LWGSQSLVDFQRSRVTSDGGLILVRELGEHLGFGELIEQGSALKNLAGALHTEALKCTLSVGREVKTEMPDQTADMGFFDKRTASVLSTILLFVALGAFIYGARSVLIAFLFAIFFAYLLDPLVSRLQRLKTVSRGSRSIAILEVYAILYLSIAVALLLVGPRIMNEGRRLGEALPGLLENVSSGQIAQQIGSRRGWSYNTQVRLGQFLANHSGVALGWVRAAGTHVAAVAQNVIWLVLIPILAIFLLKDGRNFTDNILGMVERRQQRQFLVGITEDLNGMLAHYIRSQLILAGLSLVVYMVVLSLLQVPYAFVLGPIAGIMEFIPVVGPLAGAVAILSVAFLANYHHLLIVAVFLGIWRLLQDYVTSPRIMGGTLRLHPLAVIFAVLVGGAIGGFVGVYFSIPIIASLLIVWKRWQQTYAGGHGSVKA
jgi:predicted PurR-regulated permease PerM